MQSSLEITPRGRVALVLLHLTAGAALLTGDENARLAASLVGALLAIDVAYKLLRRPQLDLRVRAHRTIARAPFREAITLHNLGNRSVRDLRLRDARLHMHSAGGAHLPLLRPGERLHGALWLRSNRRGISEVRSFRGRTEYPLGFCAWRLEARLDARLVTEPARIALPPQLLDAFNDEHLVTTFARHDDASEFHSLREYRYGEDARLVQARRSAHLGQLVRSVLRASPRTDGSLVLDLRRPAGMPDSYGGRELEVQVGHAAAAVDTLLARGVRLRCYVIDADDLRHFACDDSHSALAFLEFLAIARTCEHRPLNVAERERLPTDGPILWLTGGGHVDEVLLDGAAATDTRVLRGVVA